MNFAQPAVLAAFVLMSSPVYPVNYEINKNTTVLDDQGGSITTLSTGSLSTDLSLIASSTTFSNFLFQERPAVRLSGDLSSTLTGGGSGFTHELDGLVDVQLGDATHQVSFDNIRVLRNGLSFEIEGNLLVNGQEYAVPEGGLAERIISAIVILQGQ